MEILYVVKQLTLMFGTAFIAFIIAKGLFQNSLKLAIWEEIGILVPVGLGIIILLLFALGMLDCLSPLPVLGCTTLLITFSIWNLKHKFKFVRIRSLTANLTWNRLLLFLVGLALLVPIFSVPLTPPYRSDEIQYHLPYALRFLELGAIEPDLYLRYPFFTLNINLLYSLALMIGDDISPHFMHFMMGLLVAFNLYSVALRIAGPIVAFSCTLLFLVLPSISLLYSTAFIDLGLACFIFSSIACISYTQKKHHSSLIICAAFLFGIALGSKYLALLYVPLMCAWTYFYSRNTRSVFQFFWVAWVVGLPWYLYNIVHTGNPISPFAGEIFGFWPWNQEDMIGQIKSFEGRGFGYSISSLLMLPYNLVVNHWKFSSPGTPLILMIVFPGFFFLPWIDNKVKPFGVLLLITILIWFFSAQSLRYLVAFLPIWCFFCVWLLENAILYLGRHLLRFRSLKAISNRMPLISSIMVLASVLFYYSDNRMLVSPNKAHDLIENRESFLRLRVEEYGLVEYLRGSNIREKWIYQILAGSLLSYIRDNRVVGDYFGIVGYGHFFRKYGPDVQGFLRELAELDMSYIAINRSTLNHGPWGKLGWGSYMLNNLEVEYEDDKSILFVIPDDVDDSEIVSVSPGS